MIKRLNEVLSILKSIRLYELNKIESNEILPPQVSSPDSVDQNPAPKAYSHTSHGNTLSSRVADTEGFFSVIALFFIAWSIFSLLILAPGVLAVSTPTSITGYVYALDGITQAPVGTLFSVNNTANGFLVTGGTGRGSQTGKYAVSLSGDPGDLIIIKTWNEEHVSERNITLQGIMKNVDLLLNFTTLNNPPIIVSDPIVLATVDSTYDYDVEAIDSENDSLVYHLGEGPDEMVVDAQTGQLNWTPQSEDVGNHTVIVNVTDGNSTVIQNYSLEVVEVQELGFVGGLFATFATFFTPVPETDLLTNEGNSSITSIEYLNGSQTTMISATALQHKPEQTYGVDKRVYEYIDFSKEQGDAQVAATISFTVQKNWLEEQGIEKDAMILHRFTSEWIELPTTITGENETHVFYEANTEDFSYFAIALDEEVEFSEINARETYEVIPATQAFALSAVIVEADGTPLAQGSVLEVRNIETGEAIVAYTDGPSEHFFFVTVTGNKGDPIEIYIPNYEVTFGLILDEGLTGGTLVITS